MLLLSLSEDFPTNDLKVREGVRGFVPFSREFAPLRGGFKVVGVVNAGGHHADVALVSHHGGPLGERSTAHSTLVAFLPRVDSEVSFVAAGLCEAL